ncbi:MAG: crotonobetaine/carnitine-CoA ligase [Congregibacter sp.]|jgi:crotonobetaine/carnitine-CoA ligase
MPDKDDCVLRYRLDRGAGEHPDRRLALFDDGIEWTWAQARDAVRETAAGLQALGLSSGAPLLVWLPNGRDMVRLWFAANYIGAVFVPLNTAYRGSILEHAINLTEGQLLIAHSGLLDRLEGLDLQHLRCVVCADTQPGNVDISSRIRLEAPAALQGVTAELDDTQPVNPWDTQCVIYTSGTTGPSKGVLSPYLQLYTTAVVNYGRMQSGDCILVNLPMFHVGGTSPIYAALIRGGSFYLVDGFNTGEYWNQVRRGDCCTSAGLIGAMAPFIAAAEPRDDDSDNPLRYMTMFPINQQTVDLGRRFGFSHITGFNMTEVSTPLISDVDSLVFSSCGRPRSGVSCRLVDEWDIEVAPGDVGELIVRADLPWTMNSGYMNMPEATAQAWRNGWFHTGDMFRQDADDNFYFVDRLKDMIRRRGENISSVEVETEVLHYPGIDEVAAVGVPSESGEEEVLIVVVSKGEVEPRDLHEFLAKRLPYFMVPRYIRQVSSIPKTDTNKPRKLLFRDEGIGPGVWDCAREGITLRRERLSP